MADYLRQAASDVVPGEHRKQAMAELNERLDRRTSELMAHLIADHGLYGDSGQRIERQIQDVQVAGQKSFNEKTGALAGAVVSGALTGLAADLLVGGLSLGGGMIAGGILGALGGSALARGYRWVAGDEEPSVRWSAEFLDRLCHQVLLRYLAVAHFGRGRGAYRDLEQPSHWTQAVERALFSRQGDVARAQTDLQSMIQNTTRDVLQTAYPRLAKLAMPGGGEHSDQR
jgi:hypothetical protein